ncbi:unnamed protein product, partial [Ectocarpus fasciculatus]
SLVLSFSRSLVLSFSSLSLNAWWNPLKHRVYVLSCPSFWVSAFAFRYEFSEGKHQVCFAPHHLPPAVLAFSFHAESVEQSLHSCLCIRDNTLVQVKVLIYHAGERERFEPRT